MENLEKFTRAFLETIGVNTLNICFILIYGFFLSKHLLILLKRILLLSALDNSIVSFILSIVRTSLYLIIGIIILLNLSVSISSIIALISAFTLAISLSLQDTLSNVANGLVLAFTKPFSVGDYVFIDKSEGKIQEIKMMNTVLMTNDNKKIILPNKVVFNSEIINYSTNKFRRVDLEINVSYDSEIEKVKFILESICKNHEFIDQNIEHLIRLLRMDSSSIVFVIKVWTLSKNYWSVYYDLQENIFIELKKNNISIPFQQIDVHLD